jgi:hypothetical protein
LVGPEILLAADEDDGKPGTEVVDFRDPLGLVFGRYEYFDQSLFADSLHRNYFPPIDSLFYLFVDLFVRNLDARC